MTFIEWMESVIEAGTSATTDSCRDPWEILDEQEHELIACTGHNLNGKEITA